MRANVNMVGCCVAFRIDFNNIKHLTVSSMLIMNRIFYKNNVVSELGPISFQILSRIVGPFLNRRFVDADLSFIANFCSALRRPRLFTLLCNL